jgi:hypothetical protein
MENRLGVSANEWEFDFGAMVIDEEVALHRADSKLRAGARPTHEGGVFAVGQLER